MVITKGTISGHILIVDDNPYNIDVLFDYLSEAGFELSVAEDGERALEQSLYNIPDLILLDIIMPGFDGFETCRRFKRNPTTKDIPIIFMTALAETDDKIKGFEAGGVDYITKPFQIDEVLVRIKTHLTLHNLQKQLETQNEQLQQEIVERERIEADLLQIHEELEQRIERRTTKLQEANNQLQQEIAHRAKIEDELRQAQKMEALGRLTGGVAHDFNNLLTVILGCSILVLNSMAADDPHREDIEQIQEASQRAAALTQQLLAFSRKQVLDPKAINLNQVLDNLNPMLRRVIREEISLDMRLNPKLNMVCLDPGQIEQVIMNLVINACDAMPTGGVLTIQTDNIHLTADDEQSLIKPGNYVMLSICDTGIGISPHILEFIFDPFFTTKERDKGTGLGLSTVHGIVNQSGGHIQVHSKPNQGSTFEIYFPSFSLIDQTNSLPQHTKALSNQYATIFLVEDEEIIRKLLKRALEKAKYTVIAAQDSAEAREKYANHNGKIDLLITDVILPGSENGPQLAEYLVSCDPDMKVLFISGYADNAIEHKGILASDFNFLPKPFMPATLINKINDILLIKNG